MSKNKQAAVAFVGVCFLSVTSAWLSGFNFDHRGQNVGSAFLLTTIAASIAAVVVRFRDQLDS